MKILLTGGAGFIGSHLSEKLLEAKHDVLAVDTLDTGSIENIAHIQDHPNFQLILASVLDKKAMEEFVRDCDAIYHLAAAVGVKLIVNEPIQTIQTNIGGTETMLALANKWRKPILITSTSEVYGKNANPPFTETDDMVLGPTTNSRWSYACSKAIDEFLALAYHRQNKLPTIIARLFNTVGPRQTSQYGMVLPTFVRQAMQGEPITVYGDGTQSRTFCDVADVSFALSKLITKGKHFGEVFNIGGSEEITISDLAKMVKSECNSSSDIVYIPYDKAYAPGFEDMQRRVPNIDKIANAIGYTPQYKTMEIVRRVKEHFLANPEFV